MPAPTPSQLDFEQILPAVYNDNGQLRVDAEITANISSPQEVIISDVDDSIKIGDGAGNFVGVTANKLNVNTSGTSTVSGTVNTNLNGLTAFTTTKYSVGTSAVQLTPSPLSTRSGLIIKVVTTTSNDFVYIGESASVSSDPTTGIGFPLFNGDSIQIDLTIMQAVYAIGTSAGQRVYTLEVG